MPGDGEEVRPRKLVARISLRSTVIAGLCLRTRIHCRSVESSTRRTGTEDAATIAAREPSPPSSRSRTGAAIVVGEVELISGLTDVGASAT